MLILTLNFVITVQNYIIFFPVWRENVIFESLKKLFLMRAALFARDFSPKISQEADKLSSSLVKAGIDMAGRFTIGGPLPQADIILSLGGDGTLLSLLPVIKDSGVPVLGVNFGRLGFLSSSSPSEIVEALAGGNFTIEKRTLVKVSEAGLPEGMYPYALNEIAVHRKGAAMLGIEVFVDGVPLPVYWADGMLVATSSGSTAYSLSVGGPIVFPGSKVLIVSPIAPHNLNVRPIVLPDISDIRIKLHPRDPEVSFSLDNRQLSLGSGLEFRVSAAPFAFNIVRIPGGEFMKALTGKLFWGYDIRNNS